MNRTWTRIPAIAATAACVIALSFIFESARAQTPAATLVALTGARLIDGSGAAPVEEAVLLVRDGRVEAAGARTAVEVPAGAVRIDVSGKTIVPGFVNAHGHVNLTQGSEVPPDDQLTAQLRLYAGYGVTTVQSLGDDGLESVRLRDVQESGTLDRARLYVSGPNVTGRTVEEARENVDRVAAMGIDMLKTRVDGPADSPARMAPDVYAALIRRAHERGLRVAAHMYFLADAKGLVNAGVDVLAHSVRDQDVDAEMVASLLGRQVAYIPTLTREVSVFVYESTPEFFRDPFFLREPAYRPEMERLLDPAAQRRIRDNPAAQEIKLALQQAQRNLKRLADAGVPIAMGTDTGAGQGRWQGYFEHLELELMVEAGLTPMQALVTATGNAARVLRRDDTLGTLAPGKQADFIVLNANPLDDIRNTRQIDSVWIAGVRLAAAD